MNYQTRVWIQRFTLIAIVLPVILVVGFISAMLFMDFNQYKPELAKLISDKSGYETHINGDLSIGIWPFSLVSKQVELRNPKGFTPENLVEIKALQIQISLWSLFVDKQLRLKAVEIEGANIQLVTLANGKSNWQGLQEIAQSTRLLPQLSGADLTPEAFKAGLRYASVNADSTVDVLPSVAAQYLEFWRFDSLALHDVTVVSQVYSAENEVAEQLTISQIDLMAFDVAPNQAFKSSLSFYLVDSQQVQTWHVEGLALVTIDSGLKTWQFNDWSSTVRISLPAEMQVPEMRLTSNGESLSLDLAAQRWTLKKGVLAMSPALITFDVNGVWGQKNLVEGHLKAHDLNIPKWLRHVGLAPINFVNPKALTQVNAEFDFKTDANESSLRNVTLNVDGATLVGQVWKMHGQQELGFDLDINQLDMDVYEISQTVSDDKTSRKVNDKTREKTIVAPTSKSKPKEGILAENNAVNNTYLPLALPIDTLRSLNAKGQLTLGKLKIWQHRFEEVEIQINASNGLIDLAPLDAKLYQGRLQSKLHLDVSGITPSYAWQGKVKGITLGQLLQEGWQNSQLTGQYDSFFDLKTQGVNEYLLKQNLNGSFSAYVNQGTFKGVDLNKLLGGKASSAKDSTAFEQLALDGKVKNGIYQLQKLNFNSERFKGSGFGEIDLVNAQVNLQVNTLIIKPADNLAGLKGMQVPIQVKGPLNQVRWSVDLKGLLNNPSNQERLLKEINRFLN